MEKTQKTTGTQGVIFDTLQQVLVNMNDLALLGKQAHWNIRGRGFNTLHTFLDDVVAESREFGDEIAERLAGLGGVPDARAATVAQGSTLEQLPAQKLGIDDTWAWLAQTLKGQAHEIRENLDKVDEADAVTGDLLIGIVKALEFRAWLAGMEVEA